MIEAGTVFNNLYVEQFLGPNRDRKPTYLCRCVCNNWRLVTELELLTGSITSCGCDGKPSMKYTHPVRYKLRNIHHGMIYRCHKAKEGTKLYTVYRGRGIKVCDEWRHNFQAFFDWAVSNGYEIGLSLDRINNNKGYSPDNCRWVTAKEQNRNKRGCVYLTYGGFTRTLTEWAEVLEKNPERLYVRHRKGYTPEQILFGLSKEDQLERQRAGQSRPLVVKELSTGMIFEAYGITSLARGLHLSAKGIREACLRKHKQYKGYQFQYKDDYDGTWPDPWTGGSICLTVRNKITDRVISFGSKAEAADYLECSEGAINYRLKHPFAKSISKLSVWEFLIPVGGLRKNESGRATGAVRLENCAGGKK